MASAARQVGERVAPVGRIDAVRLDAEQIAVHGFAWMATYVEALRQLHGWASRLDEAGEFGAVEALILASGSANIWRRSATASRCPRTRSCGRRILGSPKPNWRRCAPSRPRWPVHGAGAAQARAGARLADDAPALFGRIGLADQTLDMIRDQVRRFAERAVAPYRA